MTPQDWEQIESWVQSSSQNAENWSRIESWWTLDTFGEPGSARQRAHELKEASDCAVLTRIRKALQENDAKFFYSVAVGLKQLRGKDETALHVPLHCLFWTFTFMTVRDYRPWGDPPIPTRAELIAQTKRTWAIYCLTGEMAPAPFTTFDPALEEKITREIKRLTGQNKQNWGRLLNTLGIKLPPGKSGPKPRVRPPDQRIYFAQSGNQLRIGLALNPQQRIAHMCTTRPRIKLLGHIPGDHKRLKRLHQRFSPEHIHGEWFRLTPDLKRSVSETLDAK
jgi:hypothetical protein